jgi:molecular chaperone DnaK
MVASLEATRMRSAPPPDPITAAPPPMPVVEMADRPPPLLMDVTPHSLGIETVGGYCERIIKRNAPIPIEQTRVFSTAQDDQDTVRVTVCQGESRRFGDNQPLGEVELSGLRRARRGEIRIEVTFMLDASGTLDVKAADKATGTIQRIRINLLGGYDEDEMASMRARQEASFG